MPSTYTGSGIELIGDGEQSGSWGNTTNVNLQIINRLVSEAGVIALSGTTHTLSIADGTLSDGQYAVLVFGGAPSGTNTVTLSPNDAKRVFIVSNTSGQTVILTQGSGGNVTIANGNKAIVYSDGGGASAAVVDVTPLTTTLSAIGALTPTDGNFIVGNGSTWVAESGNTVLQSLGVTATAAELNIMDGVTATAAELNIMDGVTATTAELNILDGVTATTAELNILDGVTANTSEINLLDGVTWTLADYNTLTATAAELNVLDGITGIASEAEAEAGTATDKLMTPERTKQAIEALSPAWEFESAETAAGSIITNVAHGLGATPKQVSVVLRCVSASFGYSVGDEVYVQSAIYTAGGRPENFGITYSANATNVTIRMGDSGIRLITTSGTATTDVSLGNFRWVVRASL